MPESSDPPQPPAPPALRRPRLTGRILRASVVSASLHGPFRVRGDDSPSAAPPLRQEAETDWSDPLPIILRLCRDCEPEVAVRDALTLWDLWHEAQGGLETTRQGREGQGGDGS